MPSTATPLDEDLTTLVPIVSSASYQCTPIPTSNIHSLLLVVLGSVSSI